MFNTIDCLQSESGKRMNKFIGALAVSIGLHVLLLLLFVFYQFPATKPAGDIQMEFIAPVPTVASALVRQQAQPDQRQPSPELPRTTPNSAPANLVLAPKDSIVTSPEDRVSVLKLQLNTPNFLIKTYAAKQNYDSILAALQPQKYWQPSANTKHLLPDLPLKSADPIADYLHKKNIGQAPVANFLPLLMAAKPGKRAPKPGPRLEAIPTRVQIHALNVIWQANRATLSQIYANMDSTYFITAQILEETLQDMCEKNLLERKKISPSNEFTILGPFVEHGIEMSELNRKNPVYEYSARIKRDEVIRFLQARLYLLQEQLQNEPDRFNQMAAADLMDRIRQVLTGSAEPP